MAHFTDQIDFTDITLSDGSVAYAYTADELNGDYVVISADDRDDAVGYEDYSVWCSDTIALCDFVPEALVELIGLQSAADLVGYMSAAERFDASDALNAADMLVDELLRDPSQDGWPGVVQGYIEYLGGEEQLRDELEALRAEDESTELSYYLAAGRGDRLRADLVAFATGVWYQRNRAQLISAIEAELELYAD